MVPPFFVGFSVMRVGTGVLIPPVYRSSPKAMSMNTPLRHASRAPSPQGARQGAVAIRLCAIRSKRKSLPCVKGGGFLRSKKTEGLSRIFRTVTSNPPVSACAEPAPFTQGGLNGSRGLVWVDFRKNKNSFGDFRRSFVLCWHLLIFPGRRQPSIVSASELNFRVRDGNGGTLTAIDTNYLL